MMKNYLKCFDEHGKISRSHRKLTSTTLEGRHRVHDVACSPCYDAMMYLPPNWFRTFKNRHCIPSA
jgi:hypothetical protein